jgi:XrtN system VIT domain protein
MQTTLEPGRVRRSVEALQRKDELINVMSTGYGMLALSAAFYAACVYYDVPTSDNEFLLFVIHYLFAIGYAVVLMFNKAYGISRSWKREHIHKTIILLNLFLVSAYALNRLVNVFHTSTTWLCVYLVVTSGIALTYRFYERIPGWAQAILQVVVGSSLIFYLYLTLYVAPFYAVGGFGTIVLGVGAHIFIPVILLIGLVSLIRHTYVHHDKSYYWIVIGAGLTIGYAALFTVEWTKRINRISTIYNQSVIHPDAELPTWLAVAQSIKTDWITLRILKSDLVYTTHQGSDWDFLPQGISWEETRNTTRWFISAVYLRRHR